MTDPRRIDIPDAMQETVLAEIQARAFSDVETGWLVALLADNPLTPAPTAAAMVARVVGQPLGNTLIAIEEALAQLPTPHSMLPAERRMTAVILQAVVARLAEILNQLKSGA